MTWGRNSDNAWITRILLPDLYPREQDPWRPGVSPTPASATAASQPGSGIAIEEYSTEQNLGSNIYLPWMSQPGQRPFVYQRAVNLSLSVTQNPQPIMPNQFACDTIVVSNPSSNNDSVFFGFGSFVNTTNGVEVQPGLPVAITPENTREQWELQRVLEAIAAMIAAERQWNPIGHFRSPRVVFNANEYWVVAGAGLTVPISVMVFTVPEMQ